ncbi:aspartate dehydrogenase [Limnohabitans sp. G3-2]|uniref:aspartate dehydrogenase n=1 Tax=Limnohabitans sp. G3-2 TaxID=1100711 RepID=UPI000C1F812E|nr:aspartate dehydrogenase [Limnohabitans sp. G3-2]PIT74907.1 aspartate dehydrogenase [Limnohabitans sp. G3-2]
MRIQELTLIGFGAIGRSVHQRMLGHAGVRITHIVVTKARVAALQNELGAGVTVTHQVPVNTPLVLECAGHTALTAHVLPALQRGTECAVLSIGALSEPGLPEQLQAAAEQGGTQLHLLAGAIGGVDALSAAKEAGLDSVTYIGRKPPAGWRGSPAEQLVDLDALTEPTVILEATAREAARLYPKNANVAATLSWAGLGLDRTRVRLIADPGVTDNIHEFEAKGAFGEMQVRMRGKPLPDNPKTSALTVLSAVRFLLNRTASVTT